jgi:hypothetical protein
MTTDSKRISIRVSEELFEELNDKRHAMRVSFQSLGLALFRSWLEFFPGAGFSAAVADSIRAQEPGARIPEEDPAARTPEAPGSQGVVSPRVRPLLPAFVQFWEHPKNRAEQHLKALLAETVFKDVLAASTRKTSGL